MLGLRRSPGTAVCINTRPSEEPSIRLGILGVVLCKQAESFCLNRFIVFSDKGHTVNLWAADTLSKLTKTLTKSAFTPKIVTVVAFSQVDNLYIIHPSTSMFITWIRITRFNYLFKTALDRNIKCSNKTLPLHQKIILWLELFYFIERVITSSISSEQNLRCSIFALIPFHLELACRVSIRSLSYGFNK